MELTKSSYNNNTPFDNETAIFNLVSEETKGFNLTAFISSFVASLCLNPNNDPAFF